MEPYGNEVSSPYTIPFHPYGRPYPSTSRLQDPGFSSVRRQELGREPKLDMQQVLTKGEDTTGVIAPLIVGTSARIEGGSCRV